MPSENDEIVAVEAFAPGLGEFLGRCPIEVRLLETT
jgi:hypothetical protein